MKDGYIRKYKVGIWYYERVYIERMSLFVYMMVGMFYFMFF